MNFIYSLLMVTARISTPILLASTGAIYGFIHGCLWKFFLC